MSPGSLAFQARIFNETSPDTKKCRHVLTKIMYMINQVRPHNRIPMGDESPLNPSALVVRADLHLEVIQLSLLADNSDRANYRGWADVVLQFRFQGN